MNFEKKFTMEKKVALVLDTAFGERVAELAKEMPVWIVPSQANLHVIELLRPTLEKGRVTILVERKNETEEFFLDRMLYAIDEHYGEASQSNPYETLWVFSTTKHMPSIEVISELGFKSISRTPDGFRMDKVEILPKKKIES